MKIVVIIAVLVLVLAGGGAGAYFTGMLDSLLGVEQAEGEAEKEEDTEAVTEAFYLQLDPISSPVIVNGRVEGQVILTISVQVPSAAARNDLAKVIPRMRDAILQSLYSQPLVRHIDDGTIDIRRTKQRLKDMLVDLLGTERVRDVLIVKALQTR
jgi:flagellar FliL protein